MYSRILLASDLHDDGPDTVARRALSLSASQDATLCLLHVVESIPVEPGNELMIPPTTAVESELMATAERKLRELGDALSVPPDGRYLRYGQTGREVDDVAREIEADLIVVGRHARHGLALLLGSTASTVMRGAPCDVLAVRL